MKYVIACIFLLFIVLIDGAHKTDANIQSLGYDISKHSGYIEDKIATPVQIRIPVDISIKNFAPEERHCLALNIYHEARNQSEDGQIAVGLVTLNRVLSKRYPSTICRVVKQAKYNKAGKMILHRCAFSWWCDGKDDTPHNLVAFKRAQEISDMLLFHYTYKSYDFTYGSLWYHADYVEPVWTDDMVQMTQVENHIFYAPK